MTDELGNNAPQGGGHGASEIGHVSVLLKEAIDFLAVRRGGTYIDATVGLGGHSFAIARRLGAPGSLIGFDKDPHALELARKRLAAPADAGGDWPRIELLHASFAEIGERVGANTADGLLADLGVSSLQFGDVNLPLNLAVSTNPKGTVVSVLAGYAIPRLTR